MTALRRMSAGQIITALSFVVSGFVQMAIDDKITPIPDYGNEERFNDMISFLSFFHFKDLKLKFETIRFYLALQKVIEPVIRIH